MIKTIVFDMDGVLFDTEKVSNMAWHEVAGKYNIENIDEFADSCRGRNEQGTIDIINERYGDKFSGKEAVDLFWTFHRQIIDDNGVPVKKGVYEILSYLKDNGYKIALASSSSKTTVIKYLKEVNILDYFEVIVTGDMIKNGKPSPDIYIETCSQLGEKPEDCIAIEDSFNGIKSSYNAGMKTIMVPDILQPTDEIKKLLYKKFDSLLEVKNFLENIDIK